MKVSGKNPQSSEEFNIELDSVDSAFVKLMSTFEMDEDEIKKLIDGLDISADAKSMLFSFSRVTIRAGEKIIKIGRKIIDYICRIYSEFPTASFGMVFGAIAGFLISSIPILGVVLGPLVAPILILLGMVAGLSEDLKDKALARKVAEVNAKFKPLKT
jgi:hypothetical protein